ncbi:hypothetical protein Q5752_001188 [Cryptotrichosporon argae]
MAPALRVLVSSSSAYPPTTVVAVNSPEPTPLRTPGFEGSIWVFVKDYSGEKRAGDGAVYFDKRKDMTYGIVVRGRFLDEVDADDVLFGNVFESPVRDHLPWGTSIATKFMYFIDPTLELDIYADKPWALSPALASMTHLSLGKAGGNDAGAVVDEDALGFLSEVYEGATPPPTTGDAAARRKWLGKKENRAAIKLGPDVQVGFEFCNGLLDFNTLSATLPQPFHLSVPLLKYWDGQPVTYVCQRRHAAGQSPVGKDGVFWSVAFEIVDEDARRELERKGGKAVGPREGDDASKDHEVEDEVSEDVD